MTVKELIEFLQNYPPEMPIAYTCYSEQTELEAKFISVESLCEARPDGWVANSRPDKPSIEWLVFPGN